MRKSVSGQITIFSAIILMAVIILAGLLVDISRINAGGTMVKRAAASAARSLLADYGSRLKEGYGIFALPEADETDLEERFAEYLACNLSIPSDEEIYMRSTDLFGFRIEKIDVIPIYNLSENNVVKKQILEYMKYRAPEELVEGFIDKLSAVKDLGRMSDAYKQKVGIDKIFGSMDKSQQRLKKAVDGIGEDFEKFINGFNLNGSWEAAYHNYNSLADRFASLKSSLSSLDDSIGNLKSRISELKQEASTEPPSDDTGETRQNDALSRLAELERELDSLRQERSDIKDSCSETESRIKQLWNEMRHSMTGDFIKVNEDAVGEIEKIVEKGKKAQQKIVELEKYMAENLNREEGSISSDFKEQLQTELDKLQELILDGKRAEDMLKNIGDNSTLLRDISARLDQNGSGAGGQASSQTIAGLPPELLDMIKTYTNVDYDYIRPDKGDKKKDPREGKADAVKQFIAEKILEDINYETAGIDKTSLPSGTKVTTPSFEAEDNGRQNEQNGSGAVTNDGVREAQYNGDLTNVGEDADLYNEEGCFQENALGFIADIGEFAAGQAIALRDSIYLNEYIMGSFKNSVPELKYESESVKDTDLHGIEKEGLDTFYSSEVEYILHGQPSQTLNNVMTKGELLLVRFGLNTLHVYTDSTKKTMANGIATAVAGWWTGGAGIPIISNLIMCGWSMGESLLDMTDLMDGRSVPIYKMKGDWKLDIGLAAEAGPKTDKRLYFNYHDYLRLFLLTVSENKKLDRIEDLIQLNIGKSHNGFRMTRSYTYVRIEAEVSMKYLFITQPFVQNELKTEDGRYIYRVLLYEGY